MAVYFILAVLVIANGIRASIKQRNDIHAVSLIMTVHISVAISFLVFPYFAASAENWFFALFSSVRYGASALTMNVNSNVKPAFEHPGALSTCYIILLYSLYLAGPLAASMAVLGFSRSVIEILLFGLHREVHVFSQLNEKSIVIAETLYQKSQKSLRVFCASENASDSLKSRARECHCLLVRSPETSLYTHRGTKYYFYLLYDDPVYALQQAITLHEKLEKHSPSEAIMRVFVTHAETELIRDIDSRFAKKREEHPDRTLNIHVRYLDVNEAMAADLSMDLLNHLPIGEKNAHYSLLIAGCGEFGLALARTLSWLLIQPESSLTVHIADKNAKRIASRLKAECPEFLNAPLSSYFQSDRTGKNYDIVFHEADLRESEFLDIVHSCSPLNAVFLTSGDDNLNYQTARALYRFFYEQDQLDKVFIAAGIKSAELAKMIDDHDTTIHYFGKLKERYDYEKLFHPRLEKAAESVHLSYLGKGSLDEKEREEFHRYSNYQSSFAQALASMARMQYLTCNCPPGVSREEWIKQRLRQEETVILLGECEHDRWNAYQRLCGWSHADDDTVRRIAAKTDGKKIKDDELLYHPAIVENKDLRRAEEFVDEVRRSYHPEASGCNYVELDRQIVRALPKIMKEELKETSGR